MGLFDNRWLKGATEDGGLLIPGWPAPHGCDLILRSGQVEVHAGEEAGAALAWDEFRPMSEKPEGVGDRFSFTDWKKGYRGAGIALHVEGRCAAATVRVLAASDTPRNRLHRGGGSAVRVPLVATGDQVPGVVAAGNLLDVLCSVLTARPELRARLDEPARVRRLAADLKDRTMRPPYRPLLALPATRNMVEVLDALGLGHPFRGRPVPGDDPLDVDLLVAGMAAERPDLSTDKVRSVIEKHVIPVEPWPFEALTD